jgi:hypothetical protein
MKALLSDQDCLNPFALTQFGLAIKKDKRVARSHRVDHGRALSVEYRYGLVVD